MRVLVGTENSGDLRQSELRRHLKMMSRCVETATAGSALTMILRSAKSDPAKALIGMKGALQRAGAWAKVILARIEPEDDLRQLFAGLSELAPQRPSHELIRWARNPRLLEAHEQVIYGDALCWFGDAMRRDADKRNALALFEEEAPEVGQARPARFHGALGAVLARTGAASDGSRERASVRRLRTGVRSRARPPGASPEPARLASAPSLDSVLEPHPALEMRAGG